MSPGGGPAPAGQADWSLRFSRAAEQTRHFLRLSHLVAADIDDGAGELSRG